MANDAFALSPIAARATPPREQDYEALSKTFMETSRGRWFLAEYAKRNRNADIRTVLDAVARIEANQAAQKSSAAEALAAIRGAVGEARASASAALDRSALEQSLASVRNSARVLRELSSRWRKFGADGRICDRLDLQVGAIEAGCEQIASTDPALPLSTAFDLITARIAEFDTADTASPSPAEQAVASLESRHEAPAVTPETDDDDAILDRIAFEMAADDPSDAGDLPGIGETRLAEPPFAAPEMIAEMPEPIAKAAPEPPPAAPEIITRAPEPIAAPAPPATIPPPLPQHSSQASPQPSPQPSLGAALLASGILRMPNAPASGPLAPIRRMTQAEKIAFFS